MTQYDIYLRIGETGQELRYTIRRAGEVAETGGWKHEGDPASDGDGVAPGYYGGSEAMD